MFKKSLVLGFMLLMLLALSTSLMAATIYVNYTTGNDTGNGTSGSPYKTFYKGYTMAADVGDILDITGTFDWTNVDETGGASPTGYTIGKNLTIQGQGAGQTFVQSHSSENSADRRVFTISSGTTVTIKDMTIRNGKVTDYVGGGIFNDGILTLTNCTISGNTTSQFGGGMYNYRSSPNLINCTISGNLAYGGAADGGGMYNYNSSPNLTNCIISGNEAGDDGGGMYNAGSQGISSPTLTNCTITGNYAGYNGGGIYNDGDHGYSNPTLTNCIISGNKAGDNGGGMYNNGYYGNSNPTLTNCTISGNNAGKDGRGMYNYKIGSSGSSNPDLTNCIMWDEVYNNSGACPSYSYCNVKNSGGSSSWNSNFGTDNGNNIDSDPLFASEPFLGFAPQVVADHDLLLTNGSPCLGTGSAPGASGVPPSDKDGRSRPLPAGASNVDMGAFEQYDSDASLPVELSTFYALYSNGIPTIYWATEWEEENQGWNIYRGENADALENNETIHINPVLIPGAGTTTQITNYQYEDEHIVDAGNTYWYWLESVNNAGVTEIHPPTYLTIPSGDPPPIPKFYGMHQNYPNPFNPHTEISFVMKEDCIGELSIYNIKGQKIKTLFKNRSITRDELIMSIWDGKDESAKDITSGIYLYKLITNKENYVRRMVLMK